MVAKSILEIDVSTAEFQRYAALFDKYTEKLKQQPALWAAVAKQHKALGQQFRHTADAVDDEHKKLEDLNKVNTENERRLEKSKGLWSDMAKSSGDFAKNLTSASGFLSKWGGLLFGGIIGGAAFGIDRAVHDASSNRQQALGLGVSIGELKAFAANFSRIGDTNGLLGSVGVMETDVTQRKPWYALGLGNMTGDTVKDTMALLDAERKFAQTTPTGLLGPLASAYGLPSSPEQLRLMAATSAPEWNSMKQGYAADRARMNIPGAKSLQDLETQFTRNMGSVWSTFETQLSRAAPALGSFSDAVTRGTIKIINGYGSLIDGLAKDPLGTLKGVALGATSVFGPGGSLDRWALGLGSKLGTDLALPVYGAASSAVADALLNAKSWALPTGAGIASGPQAYKDYLARRDLVSGLPKGLLEAVFQTESSGNLFPANSSAGAMGPFQFMAGTAKGLGINPYDPAQAANGAETLLLALVKRFQGDLEKALAAYNWRPGALEADIKAHGKDWLQYAPKETQDYIRKIEVIMHLTPGANVTVASNQLAH